MLDHNIARPSFSSWTGGLFTHKQIWWYLTVLYWLSVVNKPDSFPLYPLGIVLGLQNVFVNLICSRSISRFHWPQELKRSLPGLFSYSAYTVVTTNLKYCSDVILFKDVCRVFVLKRLLWEGLISYASQPTHLLLIPQHHFWPSNGGLSRW